MKSLLLVLSWLVVSYALAAGEPGAGCKPVDNLEPICGLRGSEDLEVLPGGKQMFVSQSRVDMSHPPDMIWLPGSIALLDLPSKLVRVVYPGLLRGTNDWGDASCPGEIGDRLAPHGLHLSQRSDGKRQLLVVNHGERESVEMFEVIGKGRYLRVIWRGCAIAPEHSFLNDVVALPQGGFLVTNMTYYAGPGSMMKDRARADRGENTGHVWRWQRDAGFQMLPGSETPMPNGIQVDKSGSAVYINISVPSGGMKKFDLKTGKQLGFVRMPNPDNISWADDGRLLVAGIINDADTRACMLNGFSAPCPAKFYVNAIDPETLASENLLMHEGPPMGGASVAVSAGKFLYIGSFAGDRILKAPLPAKR